MKTLYVLRHAKSSWDDSNLADFDRPLNDRGEIAAPFMGKFMKWSGFEPEIILSSPAVRARQTAALAREAGMLSADIQFDEKIYEATPRTLLTVVASIDDSFESAMIVGHNPGMEGFVKLLTGELQPMATATLAVIDLDIDSWKHIDAGIGSLKHIFRPKDEMKTFGRGN